MEKEIRMPYWEYEEMKRKIEMFEAGESEVVVSSHHLYSWAKYRIPAQLELLKNDFQEQIDKLKDVEDIREKEIRDLNKNNSDWSRKYNCIKADLDKIPNWVKRIFI